MWTDGLEDYLQYAKQLIQEYDDVINSTTTTTNGGSASIFNRLGAPPPPPTFNFAAPPAAAFSFGGSGGGTAEANNNDNQENQENDNQENDDDDGGPSLELDTSGSTAILHSQRIKLMSQDPVAKKWKDRGSGLLSLRRNKDTPSAAPYIVFTTDAGRVLLNAPLVKGLKPTVNPKTPKNVIMMLISKVSADTPEERGMHVFKCDTVESKEALVSGIEQLIGGG